MADKKGSAYGAPAGDTDFRKSYNLEEAAERAKVREEAEREERKARYEAKLAGKKYHKPLTGDETYTSARRNVLDLTGQIGKTQLVPAGAGVGRRGKGAGFYCETCDMNFKDNLSFVDHINSFEHLQNSGQTSEVKRATAEEVHERIAMWIRKRKELAEEQSKTLTEKLEENSLQMEKEAEEKRRKRKEILERQRLEKEEAAKVKVEYGEDVRIEGEHDEDDMMAQMGFTGFGTSKK